MSFWNDFWDSIFGCQYWKDLYAKCQDYTATLNEQLELCFQEKAELKRQLELCQDKPKPPEIDYRVEKDTAWVQSQLEAMKLQIIRLPLDEYYALTNRKNFANIVAWDTTDRLQYVIDFFDCDKFAMLFKVMVNLVFNLTQVADIIDYNSGHSYNLILFPDSEPMILEPQNDGMYMWTKRVKDFYSLEGAIALI